MKKSKIEFKLDNNLFKKFKKYCNENGYDMSKKLRNFIESEVPKDYHLIDIIDLKHKPDSEIKTVSILGRKYVSRILPPNIYVLETNDNLNGKDHIMFHYNNVIHKLDNCIITKDEDSGYFIIDCKEWSASYSL